MKPLLSSLLLGLGLVFSLPASPWQPLTALSLSPEGRWIATGGLAGEVLWREAETGEVLGVTQIPGELPIVSLAFSDDAKRLSLIVPTGQGYLVHLDNLEITPLASLPTELIEAWQRWSLKGPSMSGVRETGRGEGGWDVAGDPAGRITAKSPRGEPLVWQAHRAAVTGLALNAEGSLLYSSSFDGGVAVWSLPSGKILLRL